MLWPILLFLYYRLARKEEKIMHNIYGTQYLEYKSKVPMFLPVKFGRDPSLSYKSEVVNEPRSKQGNVTELGN
jgi:hypothetical protein